MNSIFKLKAVVIIALISINNSYAEPECYVQMRSLNLSVESGAKRVCAQKGLELKAPEIFHDEIKGNPKKSSVGVGAYFVYPHIENEEEEATADGIGGSISVGF